MSEAIYENYTEALRRGHAAAAKNRNAAALDAYSEAAKLAPDRALPLVGMGTVLAKLGKHKDALTAFHAAVEEFGGQLDLGYIGTVPDGPGKASHVRELPRDAELVIMRRPIAGG